MNAVMSILLAVTLVAVPVVSKSTASTGGDSECQGASKRVTYCTHLSFGPLKLLESGKAVVARFGVGTQGLYCYQSGVKICERIWKYTDGKDLVRLDMGIRSAGHQIYDATSTELFNVEIIVGARTVGIARIRAGVPAVGQWRWQNSKILSVPPFRVPGWETCGFDAKQNLALEFCGGGGPDPRSLVVSYSYRAGKVVMVSFGTE